MIEQLRPDEPKLATIAHFVEWCNENNPIEGEDRDNDLHHAWTNGFCYSWMSIQMERYQKWLEGEIGEYLKEHPNG